ncbi:hypothetical protein BDF22DRAFT_745505 [Syncephalis plumigaleata]|nr:hypothetical protein BDF22DRAFT_745505 [Syncephalis plumigaleata]
MSCLAISTCAVSNTATAFPMNFPVKDFAVSYTPASISVQPPPSPTESIESSSSIGSDSSDASSIAAVRGRAVALARMRTKAAINGAIPRQERVRKSVKFAMDVEVEYTHSADDYDRSSLPAAKLNFCNFAELLEIRASIRRQAEMTLLEATQGRIAKGNVPAMQARGIIRC